MNGKSIREGNIITKREKCVIVKRADKNRAVENKKPLHTITNTMKHIKPRRSKYPYKQINISCEIVMFAVKPIYH